MKCAKCGMPNDDAARTCVQCGAALYNPDGTVAEKPPVPTKQIVILVVGLLIMAALVIGGAVGMPIWVWLVLFAVAIVFAAIVKVVNRPKKR